MTETHPHSGDTSPKNPLRFCMVTTFYPPYNFGGDGIFVQRLARALVECGHHVTVIHCTDAYRISGGDSSDKTVLSEEGIEVHSLKSSWGPVSPLITHQFASPGIKAQELHRLIDDRQYDVIHFHNISLIGGPGVLDYGSAIKLYTAHEYWLLCPLSNLWKFDAEPCVETDCVRCTLKAGRPPQLWRQSNILQRKFAQIDAVLAPSQFVIDCHRDRGMDLNFTLLPNFLPSSPSTQLSADANLKNSAPFFLLVGRLEKTKGFQVVIEQFRQDNSAQLIVAGTGPYEDELMRLAEGADNIIFTGHIPYEKLTVLYRDAVAVIVPSIWQEPFGLIVLEAFAQTTPVIVNNSGALPELARTSAGGLVYNSSEQLLEHINTLLNEPDRRRQLGENGHNAYMANWTEDSHLKQYFQIIDRARIKKERDMPDSVA